MSTRPKKSGHQRDLYVAGLVDDLTEFEKYREEVLGKMRQMMAEGKSKEEIEAHFAPLISARKLTMALTSQNEPVALAAIKDFEDRRLGKAVEKKEHTHKFDSLPDAQLDSLIFTEVAFLDDPEDPSEQN